MSSKSINVSTRKQTSKQRKILENSVRTVTNQINGNELQWTDPFVLGFSHFLLH